MGNITEYRCENCGSSHLEEKGDFLVCQACGSKFKDKSKKVVIPEVVKVENSKNNQNIKDYFSQILYNLLQN